MSNQIDICDEVSQNFIDYAYEVNSQRSFPSVADGLKPGQRCCIWEMYKKGYTSRKPHVKSAKVSGGVIADYWPHGSTAIYETFVRMAQPFTNNIPEVDFHGSCGNQVLGADAFAADRYTECRLAPITEEGMLDGIEEDAVDMVLNFSEDMYMPIALPSIFPRLLVNGAQGLGVSIANWWIPHNFKETVNLIVSYLDTGTYDDSEYFPDFPTGGTIINPKSELRQINSTGKGKVVQQAKYRIEGSTIIFTEFCYQTYVEPIIEEIKDALVADKIEGIKSVDNKSDKDSLALCVECRKDADVRKVLAQLFKNTSLQCQYNVNQIALIGKTPTKLDTKGVVDAYIAHNLDCIRRRCRYRLNKANERIEVLQGLTEAIDNLDETISIIRSAQSPKDAKSALMSRFELSERQVDAILAIKLSSLANYAVLDLQKELDGLEKDALKLEKILNSEHLQKKMVIKKLKNLADKYGDERRTKIEERILNKTAASGDFRQWEILLDEKTRTLSKRQIKDGGKHNSDCVVLSSDKGKVFRVMVSDIPESGITDFTLLDELLIDEHINTVNSGSTQIIMLTTGNKIKRLCLDEFEGNVRNKTGMSAIKLPLGDKVIWCGEIKPEHKSVNVIDIGEYYSSFPVDEVPLQKKTSAGVTIGKPAFDEVYAIQLSNEEASGHRGGKFKKGHLLH